MKRNEWRINKEWDSRRINNSKKDAKIILK